MPRNSKSSPSATLLEAALEGLQLQRSRIDEQIAEVRRLLGQRSSAPPASRGKSQTGAPAGPRGRRPLSASARKRIAAAQKRRWAEYRKQGGGASEARGRKAPAVKKSGAAKKGAAV